MGTKKRRTPASKKIPLAGDTPPVGPPSEFRNRADDAWYSVNLVLYGETLVVKYREFTADPDEQFHAGDLTTSDEITAFRRRFRPLSNQLEASDCGLVKEGMRVCALREFAGDDRRYYDAIVEAVKHEEHAILNGVEKCSCSFVLSWLHGPEAGTLTSAIVEDLCPIHSHAQLDPRLACFLEIAKWKQGIPSPCSKSVSEDGNCNQESLKLGTAMEIQFASLDDEEAGDFAFERDEDVDLGGGDCTLTNLKQTNGKCLLLPDKVGDATNMNLQREDHIKNAVHRNDRCFILVENLEKDVSPSTIVDFIRDASSVEVEAFVFQGSSSEPYARGALVVDTLEELERLCNFADKQDQMIISSKGRPWIVPKSSALDWVRPSFWCLEPDRKEIGLHSTGSQLKIVKLGNPEYGKAVKLRELFLEFAKHQSQLFKRLALEEEKIVDSLSRFSGSQL